MKKKLFIILIITTLLLLLLANIAYRFRKHGSSNYVSDNGFLHTHGSSILNEYDETFQLKGLSSAGIQWYSDLLTYDNLKQLKEISKINIIRVAVYSTDGGYIDNPQATIESVNTIINVCISLDLYVDIDWHILSDGNPNENIEYAKTFFTIISQKYRNCPNIIYEICNEPNNVSWNDIVSYSNIIIPLIRKSSPLSLIIVGTPNWSKDLVSPADNPLIYKNIVYSYHVYCGSEKTLNCLSNIKYAYNHNVPVFISEFGLTDETGSGTLYIGIGDEIMKFINENSVSWTAWSISVKDESSSILISTFSDGFNIADYLTESGIYILNHLN